MASCADILRSEFPDLDGELFAYVTGERLPPARWGSASRDAACRDTSPLWRQGQPLDRDRRPGRGGWGTGRGPPVATAAGCALPAPCARRDPARQRGGLRVGGRAAGGGGRTAAGGVAGHQGRRRHQGDLPAPLQHPAAVRAPGVPSHPLAPLTHLTLLLLSVGTRAKPSAAARCCWMPPSSCPRSLMDMVSDARASRPALRVLELGRARGVGCAHLTLARGLRLSLTGTHLCLVLLLSCGQLG